MYRKKLVFWSACTGMLLFGISLITLGSVGPDLKEKLGLTEIASGTLFSILPLGILAGSLIFGPVVDRYGYKILMWISCLLLAAGFEGIAWSQDAGLLRIFIFIVGISVNSQWCHKCPCFRHKRT
jgi:MFS family permease